MNLLVYVLIAFVLFMGIARIYEYGEKIFKMYLLIKERNTQFKELQAKQKEMLAKGESHKWIEVTGPNSSKITVCEKTGWCPSKKGFLPKASIEALKSADNLENEYFEYREKKIQEIAQIYGLTPSQVEDIYIEIMSTKKDFYVKNMAKVIEAFKK
jgi:hypothetical protein